MNKIKCLICKNKKKINDFYHENICYKCDYQSKISIKNMKAKKVTNKCKICEKNVPDRRRKYCSDKCQDAGKRKCNSEYWYRNVKSCSVFRCP